MWITRRPTIKISIVLLVTLFLITGCWSRNELTELAIVSGMAIDIVDDEYYLTVQVINPAEIAGQATTSRLAVTTYATSGRSIFEAIRRLSKESAKRLYFSHLRMVVIGEEVAKGGIGKILELMSRDHEFRTDFFTVIAKNDNAADVLKVLTALEKNPANKIFTSLKVSHSFWAPTLGVKLDELISEMTAKGDNPVLSGIIIEGSKNIGNTLNNVERIEPGASILIDHLAAFKGDKLVGWMNEDESKGHNYITDNVEGTVGIIDWEGGNITFEIRETTTKLKAKIKNETPKVIVNVNTEVQIGEVQAKVDLLDANTLKELEEKLNKAKEDKIQDALKRAKELKTDIFGFGELIHREDPKLWSKLEKTWHKEGFVDLDVEIKTTSHIRRLGTTNESFLNEIQGGS